MKLTDLKIGDKIIIDWYDDKPATVVEIDDYDKVQPVRATWEDGTYNWPDPQYAFMLVE